MTSMDEQKRLHAPTVNYFGPEKGPFRCGHCIFYDLKRSYCEHPEIRADVNYSGCCNLYTPNQ